MKLAVDHPELPSAKGAYALHFSLETPLTLAWKKGHEATLAPGHYVYVGSANGPGGIKARVSRHLKSEKSIRWHIDRLTTQLTAFKVEVREGGAECAWVAEFLGCDGTEVPIKGFGSSDCRVCPSHFLKLEQIPSR